MLTKNQEKQERKIRRFKNGTFIGFKPKIENSKKLYNRKKMKGSGFNA